MDDFLSKEEVDALAGAVRAETEDEDEEAERDVDSGVALVDTGLGHKEHAFWLSPHLVTVIYDDFMRRQRCLESEHWIRTRKGKLSSL